MLYARWHRLIIMLFNKVLTWQSSKLYLSYQVYLPYIMHIRTYINSRKTAQLWFPVYNYIACMLYLIALSQYLCNNVYLANTTTVYLTPFLFTQLVRLHWYFTPCSRLYHRYYGCTTCQLKSQLSLDSCLLLLDSFILVFLRL